jgi:lysine 2,3-aminomutase
MDKNWSNWVWQQTHAVKDFSQLKKHVPWLEEGIEATSNYFRLQITPYYLSLLSPSDPEDALAKICIPNLQELITSENERVDPIGDRVNNEELKHSPTEAIVHRYSDRCLLLLTPLCASYCRYCFRRETVSKVENAVSQDVLEASYAYIQKTKSLREVILSGGDPLLLSDNKLAEVLQKLDAVEHLRSVRIHTRFPIFNPFRITDELVSKLTETALPVVIMLHVMHPREVTPEFKAAMKKLRKAGVVLLNQSVLIKGCNDDVEILKELSYLLGECGIIPQYLHLLDLAKGTSHFRVPIKKAQQLMQGLNGKISGHLIPQLTLEIPGGYGKISMEDTHFHKTSEGLFQLTSPHLVQKTVIYRDAE